MELPQMIRSLVLGLMACALAAPVFAKDREPESVADVPTFLQKQAELRDAIQHSKKYAHVKPEAKQKIFAAQAKLETLLKGHKTVDELAQDDKIEVFNAQTEIVAQLDDAEPDRVICSNEAKTGSHLSSVSCMTKRDRDEQRENVRKLYQNGVKSGCINRACAGSN
jgi:hypothetical protein